MFLQVENSSLNWCFVETYEFLSDTSLSLFKYSTFLSVMTIPVGQWSYYKLLLISDNLMS